MERHKFIGFMLYTHQIMLWYVYIKISNNEKKIETQTNNHYNSTAFIYDIIIHI